MRAGLREQLHGKTKAEQQALVRAFRAERPKDYEKVTRVQQYDRRFYISERHMQRALRDAQTADDILGALTALPPWYEAEGIVHGTVTKEHVIKQVELALRFKTSSPVMQSPALRAALLRCEEGLTARDVTNAEYAAYVRERLPQIVLTPEEMARFIEKVPLSVWTTIDLEMEAPILLANAQEHIFTTACCSGHEMEHEHSRAYITIQTNDPLFISVVRSSNQTSRFLESWDLKRLGSFTARSPLDRREVSFDDAEKGWTFDIFHVPTREQREAFRTMTPENRRRERDAYIQYLVGTLERYRAERGSAGKKKR
jgi:hypothetical protein